jgi:hypothetical protein
VIHKQWGPQDAIKPGADRKPNESARTKGHGQFASTRFAQNRCGFIWGSSQSQELDLLAFYLHSFVSD